MEVYVEKVVFAMLILNGNHFQPKNITERMVHISMFFVGILSDAVIFGNMAVLFQNLNLVEQTKKQKLDEINSYLNILNFSNNISNEIRDYHEILWWRNRENFIQQKPFKELNYLLKTRIKIQMIVKHIEKLHFFENEKFSKNFLMELCNYSEHYLILPNDIVVFEGVTEQNFYLCSKNSKLGVKVNGKHMAYLKEGDYFGEISFFLNCRRTTATVVSSHVSMIFKVKGKKFTKLLYDYPMEAGELYKVALQRFKKSTDFLSSEFYTLLFNDGIKDIKKNRIWNEDIISCIKTATETSEI